MMGDETENIKHALWTVGILAVGYYLGAWYTGRVAYAATGPTQVVLAANVASPEWVETVKAANKIALGVFVLSILLWMVVDYYGNEE